MFLFGRKPRTRRRLGGYIALRTRYEYIPITSETSGLHAKLNFTAVHTFAASLCARLPERRRRVKRPPEVAPPRRRPLAAVAQASPARPRPRPRRTHARDSSRCTYTHTHTHALPGSAHQGARLQGLCMHMHTHMHGHTHSTYMHMHMRMPLVSPRSNLSIYALRVHAHLQAMQ